MAVALAASTGCTRAFYRNQADREVYSIVRTTASDPRWALPHYKLEFDPRSRYADFNNPDRPPMPFDDPHSHQFMIRVDGMRGYKHWLKYGIDYQLENPRWVAELPSYVPMTEDDALLLDLPTALRVAYIHNRDARQQLETLYLSALDVSAERFNFNTQYFGTNDTFWTYLGKRRAGGESSRLSNASNLQLQRHFATGGDLLVSFANAFVWEFAGPNSDTATGLVSGSLFQPLLRQGGRAVNLETLTIAERALLANLRALQRYRQGFYTDLAIGDQGVGSLQRRGGFFGGSGLTGFTGVGAGGFGGVGGGTFGGFGGGGGNNTGGGTSLGFAGGGAGSVGGFIGLLQSQQNIRNLEASLEAQLRNLRVLEANFEAGLIDIQQVDQFRQTIETSRAGLLNARNGLQGQLDRFKSDQLGLPPHVKVDLDGSFIRPFQLVDPQVTVLEGALSDFADAHGANPNRMSTAAQQAAAVRLRDFYQQISPILDTTRGDLAKLDEAVPIRLRQMQPAEAKVFEADVARLHELLGTLSAQYVELDGEVTAFEAAAAAPSQAPDEALDDVPVLVNRLLALVRETSLVQARARLESVYVDPIDLDSQTALQIARFNRLDWMNNRASLVDTWRLIQFNANALMSRLDVTVDGDIGTIGDNIVDFDARNGRARAGLEFDAPFTRVLERNNYRQVLIDYQRARRGLVQYEDGVNATLRGLLRQLALQKANLEIQRRAVVIAVRRVDQTRERLNEPPGPSTAGAPAAQSLGDTAALNLIQALSDLRSTQDNFMSVWLAYYASRMVLMRELGILQLDDRGMWIDEPFRAEDWLGSVDCPTPPAIPLEWLNAAGVEAGIFGSTPSQFDPMEEQAAVGPGPDYEELPIPGTEAADEAENASPLPPPADNSGSPTLFAPPNVPSTAPTAAPPVAPEANPAPPGAALPAPSTAPMLFTSQTTPPASDEQTSPVWSRTWEATPSPTPWPVSVSPLGTE